MKINFIKLAILLIPVDGLEKLPQSKKINYDNKRGIPEYAADFGRTLGVDPSR